MSKIALSGNASGTGTLTLAAPDTDSDFTLSLPDASGTVVVTGSTALTPSGTVIWFAANAAPTGYLKANGAAVSRTTYAALFTAIGTTFGAGDGSTTFALPDLRGEFIRGFDDGRGVDSGRAIGSYQKGSLIGVDGPGGSNCSTPYGSTFEDMGVEQTNATAYPNAQEIYTSTASSPSARFASTDAGVGVARPRNVALLACIKF